MSDAEELGEDEEPEVVPEEGEPEPPPRPLPTLQEGLRKLLNARARVNLPEATATEEAENPTTPTKRWLP